MEVETTSFSSLWLNNGEYGYIADLPAGSSPIKFAFTQEMYNSLEKGSLLFYGDATITKVSYFKSKDTGNVLWTGSVSVNWDQGNVPLSKEMLEKVPEGANINVYYELEGENGHEITVRDAYWVTYVTSVDLSSNEPNPFTFEYSEQVKDAAFNTGSLVITGFGYKVTKVTYTTD